MNHEQTYIQETKILFLTQNFNIFYILFNFFISVKYIIIYICETK